MKFPPLLAAGARVALLAPAGPIRDTDLERAKPTRAASDGSRSSSTSAQAADGYLAGSDEQRARDLNDAIADKKIDAIWCLRGGYGAMRILDAIDYQTMARRPKALIGYSDVTALHAAFGRLAKLVGFHGPTARQNLPPFSAESLECAVVRGENSCGEMPKATTLVGGTAHGTARRRQPGAAHRAHRHTVRPGLLGRDSRHRGRQRGALPHRPHADAAAAVGRALRLRRHRLRTIHRHPEGVRRRGVDARPRARRRGEARWRSLRFRRTLRTHRRAVDDPTRRRAELDADAKTLVVRS